VYQVKARYVVHCHTQQHPSSMQHAHRKPVVLKDCPWEPPDIDHKAVEPKVDSCKMGPKSFFGSDIRQCAKHHGHEEHTDSLGLKTRQQATSRGLYGLLSAEVRPKPKQEGGRKQGVTLPHLKQAVF
jgi:hypothetical protein